MCACSHSPCKLLSLCAEDIYQAPVAAWPPLAGSSSGTLLRQLTLPRAELGWGAQSGAAAGA